MKLNNKGVTLIESIVTIAIIAITFSAIAMSFRYITHFMIESSQIKTTSNDIYEKIQREENTGTSSTMIFSDSISVRGKTYAETQKYNDKDTLMISRFIANIIDKPVIPADVNFRLILHTKYIGQEDIINTIDAITGKKSDCLYENVKDTDDVDEATSYIADAPQNFEYRFAIEQVIQWNAENGYSQLYNDPNGNPYNVADYKIVWYKIKKENETLYTVYGYIKPINVNVATCKFIIDGKETAIYVDVTKGLTKEQFLKALALMGYTENDVRTYKFTCKTTHKEYTANSNSFINKPELFKYSSDGSVVDTDNIVVFELNRDKGGGNNNG